MKIGIIIYLLVGVLLNLIGPLAKMVKDEIIDTKKNFLIYSISENKTDKQIRIIAAEIVMRFLILSLFPIGYILWIDHYKKERKRKEQLKDRMKKDQDQKLKDLIDNKSFLYFGSVSGGGIIHCHGCGYSEEIVGFVHGGVWYSEGYQCKSCGKFGEVEYLGDGKYSSKNCRCGGELSREKPIFCPICKTHDVSYQLKYLT